MTTVFRPRARRVGLRPDRYPAGLSSVVTGANKNPEAGRVPGFGVGVRIVRERQWSQLPGAPEPIAAIKVQRGQGVVTKQVA